MFPLTSHWPKLSSQDDSACKEGKKMSISGSHVPIWKFYYYRRRGKHICKDILYFLPAVLIFAFPKYVFYPSGANFVYTLGKQPNLTLLSCLSGKSLHHVGLCDSMDCSPPGSSVHGILQARIREWLTMPSSRGLPCPPPGDLPNLWLELTSHISCIGRRVLYHECHLEGP